MQGLTTLDFQIFKHMLFKRIFSCSVLDFLMPKITALENGGILWILLAILLLILPKTRKNGIQLGVGCVGCGLIGNLFLKNVIARNRPCWIEDHTMLIAMPTDFSFPSGHTMVSFAAATVLWHWNRKVGIAAYLLAAVIAFSRAVFVCTFPIGRIRWRSDWRFDWNRSHKRNRLDAEKIPETKELNH